MIRRAEYLAYVRCPKPPVLPSDGDSCARVAEPAFAVGQVQSALAALSTVDHFVAAKEAGRPLADPHAL